MKKCCLYYTAHRHDPEIEMLCRRQLDYARGLIPLVAVGLQPFDYGDQTIVLSYKPGKLTMARQILAGLAQIDADVVYFCENDLLYHPNHFNFVPPRNDVFFYNEHTYKVDWETGQGVFYFTKQTSGLIAYHSLLLQHYEKRVARIEAEGKYDRRIGYEPGCHQYPRGIDHHRADRWMSVYPNIDLRHKKNLTRTRWSTDGFRDKNACRGWTMVDHVPGWGTTRENMENFVKMIPIGGQYGREK